MCDSVYPAAAGRGGLVYHIPYELTRKITTHEHDALTTPREQQDVTFIPEG